MFAFEAFDAKYNSHKVYVGAPDPWGLQAMATPILEVGAAVLGMSHHLPARPAVTFTPVDSFLAEASLIPPCHATYLLAVCKLIHASMSCAKSSSDLCHTMQSSP